MSRNLLRRRPYRAAAAVLLVIAVACAVAATAFQSAVLNQAHLIPAVDNRVDIGFSGRAEVVFDSAAWLDDRPHGGQPDCAGPAARLGCFTRTAVPVEATGVITTAPDPQSRKNVAITARGSARAGGIPLWSTTVTETVDRVHGRPADGTTVSARFDQPVVGVNDTPRILPAPGTGLTFFFPPVTPLRSVEFFDPLTRTTTPIDYADPVPADTVKNYAFHQLTGPVNLSDNPAGNPSRLTVAAGRAYTGIELRAQGLDPDTPVKLSRYRFVHRVVVVHRDSGIIVNETVKVRDEFARTRQEAAVQAFGTGGRVEPETFAPAGQRTALSMTAGYDKPTSDDAADRALHFHRDLAAATRFRDIVWLMAGISLAAVGYLSAGALRRRIRSAKVS
ncbi:porin PorA family protein [Corynebacterium mendelii]|uniref:DUF3068 domain-containing protein n=1 Tax=Corynebacterium mendelii TaxID=2765362 RepID=A0A939E3S5_9CORY|nr:porin PorA family protein [Corynebacterium mendelii]MBN9645228.1 DUF3068 domain-containing protein [Corynebacterium mendelii]